MPRTRREKRAENDAKVIEAAIEGDFTTLYKMGKGDAAEHAQEMTKGARVTRAARALSKTALVTRLANEAEMERRQQAADASAKEAERYGKEAAQYRAESDRIQRELKEMEGAGVKEGEDLLLSWAAVKDTRIGTLVWNLQPTEKIETNRGTVEFPRGAKGELVALKGAGRNLAWGSTEFADYFYSGRHVLIRYLLYNPATKCLEPFNVAVYYKFVSTDVPYTDLYAAADSWCRNWSRYHVHWCVLRMKLRCRAWLRRVRTRLATHHAPSNAKISAKICPVALAKELWDHGAQLRVPFGPDDLLFTTFAAENAVDHMLVPCRSLPADVDLVLRRWMYQRSDFVSRAHLESQRNGRSRFNAVLPVLHLWCDDDAEWDAEPFEPFYSAAPDGRFQSLEEFAKWWDTHVRSMGTADRLYKHGTRADWRFTNADCVGGLSDTCHMDVADNDKCPQFRLGELIEAVETKRVVLKVDLHLQV